MKFSFIDPFDLSNIEVEENQLKEILEVSKNVLFNQNDLELPFGTVVFDIKNQELGIICCMMPRIRQIMTTRELLIIDETNSGRITSRDPIWSKEDVYLIMTRPKELDSMDETTRLCIPNAGFRVRYTKKKYLVKVPKQAELSMTDSSTDLAKFCNTQCLLECNKDCILWKYKRKN